MKKIKAIKKTGKCDYNCKDCKLLNLCSTMKDTNKKIVARIYLG